MWQVLQPAGIYFTLRPKRLSCSSRVSCLLTKIIYGFKKKYSNPCIGPKGSRRFRLPDFMINEGGKIASPKHRPNLHPRPPGKYPWYTFLLEAESTVGPLCGRKEYRNPQPSSLHRCVSTNGATMWVSTLKCVGRMYFISTLVEVACSSEM